MMEGDLFIRHETQHSGSWLVLGEAFRAMSGGF